MAYVKTTLEYKVYQTLATISETETSELRFTIMSWGDHAPKYDLRTWKKGKDGKFSPTKGITLSLKDAQTLAPVLSGLTVDPASAKEEKSEKKATPAKKGTTKGRAKAVANASEKEVEHAEYTPEELAQAASLLRALHKA